LFSDHVQGKIWGIKASNMKPQKALQSSLSTFMVILLILAPLNSSEMVGKSESQTISTQHIQAADGSSKENLHLDFNAMEANRKNNNQSKLENTGHEKKHADEEKHSNHVYSYDWIKNRKKIVTDILRSFTMIFVAVSYIAVLLCGYMSLLH
jgi:hypothetical protein